jgi:membrane associated rhomboid family serine protease
MFIIWIASGTLLWLIAKTGSNHIGASGLVYGYIAFLITHAFISRNKESIAASFVLIFLYGGIVYGLFPEYGRLIGKNISWEGHLSGALMGIALAFIYRKYGPRKKLYFEDEDEDEEDDNFPEEDWLGNEDLKIRYIYRKDANEEQS